MTAKCYHPTAVEAGEIMKSPIRASPAAAALVTALAVGLDAQQARPPQPGTTLSVREGELRILSSVEEP